MSLIQRVTVVLTAMVVLDGCGASAVRPPLPEPDFAKHASTCNHYMSIGRATQSARHSQATVTCTGPGIGDIFGDVQSFMEMVDATSNLNPCEAGVPRCGNDQYSFWDEVIADPGGPARRGDNCTPVNGYAIGYSLGLGTGGNTVTAPGQPIPGTLGSTTIVNQSQIFLQNFSNVQAIGWLLYTQGNGVWFVPDLNIGFAAGALQGSFAVPGAYRISDSAKSSGKFVNAIRGVFNLVANQNGISMTGSLAAAFRASGGSITNMPCNTTQLT